MATILSVIEVLISVILIFLNLRNSYVKAEVSWMRWCKHWSRSLASRVRPWRKRRWQIY